MNVVFSKEKKKTENLEEAVQLSKLFPYKAIAFSWYAKPTIFLGYKKKIPEKQD